MIREKVNNIRRAYNDKTNDKFLALIYSVKFCNPSLSISFQICDDYIKLAQTYVETGNYHDAKCTIHKGMLKLLFDLKVLRELPKDKQIISDDASLIEMVSYIIKNIDSVVPVSKKNSIPHQIIKDKLPMYLCKMLLKLAYISYSEGNLDEYFTIIESTYKLYPNDPYVNIWYARTLKEQKEYGRAIEILNKFLVSNKYQYKKFDKRIENIHAELASLYAYIGDKEKLRNETSFLAANKGDKRLANSTNLRTNFIMGCLIEDPKQKSEYLSELLSLCDSEDYQNSGNGISRLDILYELSKLNGDYSECLQEIEKIILGDSDKKFFSRKIISYTIKKKAAKILAEISEMHNPDYDGKISEIENSILKKPRNYLLLPFYYKSVGLEEHSSYNSSGAKNAKKYVLAPRNKYPKLKTRKFSFRSKNDI